MDVIELWWLYLAIAAVVVLVVAILLGLIIATAKRIDHHAQAIWVEGKHIAGNTVSIWMLEKALQKLDTMTEATESINDSLAVLNERLQRQKAD